MSAEKLDQVGVVPGRIIRMRNTNKPKFSNAKDEYNVLWIEDADGSNERCLFFTPREIAVAELRGQKNKEDWPKKGLLQDLID